MNEQLEAEDRRPWAGAVVGGGIVVALIGVLAWFALGASAASEERPAWRPPVSLKEVWEAPVVPQSALTSAESPPVASASAAVAPGRLEVCGLGVVNEIDWDRRARQQVAAAEDAKARRRVVDIFGQDTDELTRAVSLVLQSSGGDVVLDEVVPCEGVACPAEPDRIESAKARQRRVAANTAPRDRLARMALVSKNAEVYGLAWQVCRTQGARDEPSACQLVSSDQWARLEPANAVPWFEVANQAALRGDRAAVTEALYRVSQASTSNARAGRLTERMLSRMPTDVTALTAMAIATELSSIERGWAPSTGNVLNEHCSAAALRDANRQQRCDAVAEVLVRHGTATAEVLDGIRLGERLGWPAARIDALRAEMDALLQASFAQLPERSLSCASISRYLRHLQEVGQHGERAAGRRMVEASGRTVAEWARVRAETQAKAEQAASAPAVP